MGSMLVQSPLSLCYVDLANDSSLPIHQSKTSLLHNLAYEASSINEESFRFQDDEVDMLVCGQKENRSSKFADATLAVHAKDNIDEDFGLRINSRRGEFAQKYLFKSGFKNFQATSGYEIIEEDN